VLCCCLLPIYARTWSSACLNMHLTSVDILIPIDRMQRARSQVSTAVSFEGARPAGSAALPSRSVDEESALSAAEADGELLYCVRCTVMPLGQ